MKKIFILFIIFEFSFATIDYTSYEKKVDKMANYSLNIDYNKIYNPFFIPKTINKLELNNSKIKINTNIKKLKSIKPVVKVIAELNNKILLEVKTDKISSKWLEIGESLKKIKFLKIDNDIIYLQINDKIKKIKFNKEKLKVKVF